jgi:gluconate 5-dehydrogenase
MTPSAFDLHGRRALVTGSTRGIGAGIALGLARAGATVIVHGREPGSVAAARREQARLLAAEGLEADLHAAAFDVTDHPAMLREAARVEAETGPIDILVNNAGVQLRSPLLDLPVEAWQGVLSANLTSCFVLTQHVARTMVARGAGKVINVCSVQTAIARPTTAPYAAAKAGLASLTRTMCAEWAASGLQINALAPGYIDTDLNAALRHDSAFSDWIIGRTPARRWGTPADLAGPAVWLASSASDFVNGQVIYVDGGLTAVI